MAFLSGSREYDGDGDADYLRSLWDTARDGTPEDQFALAEAYRGARRVSQSQRNALKWYGIAAANGSGDALFELSGFYRRGKYGLGKDIGRSMMLLEDAAEAGSVRAMVGLSGEYLTGRYAGQDFGEALFWARRAYEGVSGLPDCRETSDLADRAIWNLCCALAAEGSRDSLDEAVHRLYKIKRRDSRFEEASTALLGYIYETAPYGDLANQTYAASMYRWVVKYASSSHVACRLADMYWDGRGVEQSYG